MGTARRRRTLVVAVLVAAVVSVLSFALLRATGPHPVRVLIVGDSVTQGSSGDWTWRYRLWKHLSAVGAHVDLVGPRDDLFDRATATFGSQEYVDPHFDRDHAARWGMTLAAMDQPVGDLVRDYRPDVVVELLGVNDLASGQDDAATVAEELAGFVADARAANPRVDVVLCALPQVWLPGVPRLDALLPPLALSLDTTSSRVVVAHTGRGFVEGVDTYDPAHPSATGEVRLAAGVADALAGLGIGRGYPRPLREVPNGPRGTAFLLARPEDGAAYLVWQPPPGADTELVWVRDRTAGTPWTRLPFPVLGTAWQASDLVNGHAYDFRLQSAKGSAVAQDRFSNVVTVHPGPLGVPSLSVP